MSYIAYIDGLLDVDASAPASGDVLRFDGTSWVNATEDYRVITSIKIAAYTAAAGEIVRVDPSAGGFTVTLPATHVAGSEISVKNVTDSLMNAVTVDPADLDTIDGSTTYSLRGRRVGVTFVSDGTDWMAL